MKMVIVDFVLFPGITLKILFVIFTKYTCSSILNTCSNFWLGPGPPAKSSKRNWTSELLLGLIERGGFDHRKYVFLEFLTLKNSQLDTKIPFQ